MTQFFFGDFSEQEAEKFFGQDKQGVKFPWATDDCLNTTIEFGFDVPPIRASNIDVPAVSYPNSNSFNENSSQQESTSSALTSPPGSSKSSTHHRHHSDRKLKKKRPPNYYKQEYQQMLEASTLQYRSNQNDETTKKTEQITNDPKYLSCDQWVDSTMKHQSQQSSTEEDDEDEEEIDTDDHPINTDTDNEHETETTQQPINIIKTNNETTSIYSTSVASGASIETLKPSMETTSNKNKPNLWADLFRNANSTQPAVATPPPAPFATASAPSASTTTKQNGKPATTFYPKTNYNVYNSNGEDSRTLEDYFSKCELRSSAMAIKPRGLINRSNYCYVNATLQALLACPAFFNVMKYIPLNDETEHHQVPCIRALHSFVNQFDKMDRTKANNHREIICGTSFDANEILQELSRLRHQPIELILNKQEDAHELLCQLLNEIHDEICQILYPTSNNKNEESISSSDLSTMTADLQLNGEEKSEDWLQVGKKNRTHVLRTNEIQKSLISDIFAGKFRSIIHSAGNQKSVVHEPFFTLSLDIKDPKITTLDEALIRFCEQSTLSDYLDNKHRQTIPTNKSMLIEHLPPILIIHLKSFVYDEKDGAKKLNKIINYAINLSIPKNILTESAKKQIYDRYKLFAVEYHQGDHAVKGHYITDVFHPGLQGWLRCDDSNVYVVPSSQVISPSADKLTPYLLFYRRGD